MKSKDEEKAVKIIKEMVYKLGDGATITQDEDLKITITGDWTNGHPTSRPKRK